MTSLVSQNLCKDLLICYHVMKEATSQQKLDMTTLLTKTLMAKFSSTKLEDWKSKC